MKKILSLLLVAVMVFAFAACNNNTNPAETTGDPDTTTAPGQNDEVKVMTHDEYIAAEMDAAVVVETYVQAHQSWWDNKVTVYCQSPDGAYFLYELACSEADAAKLVPGTKIRVSGTKGAWAGEVEIMNGTFEFVEGGDTFIAPAFDATALLGKDELINHQNEYAVFKSMTVEKIEYKNNEPGDDIYVTLSKDGVSYSFCIERYLTAPDTEVYKAVGELKTGDVIDAYGFIYWYEGVNTHITKVVPAAMTHEQYIAAEMDSKVVIETYVQAHQSWWNDKVTVYCQSPDGAYFLYELACSEADAAKLVPGTKIRVSGTKGAWAGEIEIMNGTFEFVEDGDTFIAPAFDATAILASDELINHQNEFAVFKGMTVEKIEYKNGTPGDDIYLTLSQGGASYNFCVEYYLTGTDTDVYKAVGELKEGDVIDVEGFIYWYEGVNTHITKVTK